MWSLLTCRYQSSQFQSQHDFTLANTSILSYFLFYTFIGINPKQLHNILTYNYFPRQYRTYPAAASVFKQSCSISYFTQMSPHGNTLAGKQSTLWVILRCSLPTETRKCLTPICLKNPAGYGNTLKTLCQNEVFLNLDRQTNLVK